METLERLAVYSLTMLTVVSGLLVVLIVIGSITGRVAVCA